MARRSPGILPVEGEDWLRVDDAFAAQMAERDRLFAEKPDLVVGMLESARPAAEELLETVLDHLRATPGYRVGEGSVTRPDGVTVCAQDLDGKPFEIEATGLLAVCLQHAVCKVYDSESGCFGSSV